MKTITKIMKNCILLILLVTCFFETKGQITTDSISGSYVVVYKKKNKFNVDKEKEVNEEAEKLGDKFPKHLLTELNKKKKAANYYYHLLHQNNISVYEFDSIGYDADYELKGRKGEFHTSILYKDLDKGVYYRNYIENNASLDSIDSQWKTHIFHMKSINNYICYKATKKDDDGKEMIAYYAPKISISDGPGINGGLPGLILYLETDESIITCMTIEMVNDKVEIPKFKKILSEEENQEQVLQMLKDKGK